MKLKTLSHALKAWFGRHTASTPRKPHQGRRECLRRKRQRDTQHLKTITENAA